MHLPFIRSLRKRSVLFVVLSVSVLVSCQSEPQSGDSSGPPSQTHEEQNTPSSPSPGNALHAELAAKNPNYERTGKFKFQDGRLVAAVLRESNIRNLVPLRSYSPRALDLQGNPVSDLSPLKGMDLQTLYLENTEVENLSPLKGMPLQTLYLNRTPVKHIDALQGMPLRQLNLFGTAVEDLSPLKGAPLEMLWLNETPARDISPLRGAPLISLTLQGTDIRNIQPVGSMSDLERLHIADTPVTDLTPLRKLSLTRLVFTPSRIETGIDIVRNMDSIREIGTQFGRQNHTLFRPDRFWQLYDQGQFNR